MVEIIAAIARWLQLAVNLFLLGSCVFISIATTGKRVSQNIWIGRLERLFPWLAGCIVLSLFTILFATIVQITGNINNVWQPNVWRGFIEDTRVGQIWVWRIASALLLFLVIISIRRIFKSRWQYILCAVTATLPLIAGSLASHVAAEDLSIAAVMPYALHLILAGVWFGALPALLLLIHENNNIVQNAAGNLIVVTIKRFSAIALPVMLLIILTGITVADRIFNGYYAALVATPYGWLLSIKIFLLSVILLIAARVRSYWLPLLSSKQASDVASGKTGIKKWVSIEFALAAILVLVATIIANTAPVKHALIENWPFPFRFSLIATWNQPNVALQVWIGIAFLLLAAIIVQWGRTRSWELKYLFSIPVILFISGLAIALPPLSIQAYPETYRRPPVPFDAISVANGAALYAQHCVECHGYQGMGNGIKSRTLSTKLPDLLVDPHTIEHTPGDFFHWITYGMANTDMPDYATKLSDEDRWDLVNFIHALSRGYQARILSSEIVPNKAYVKPPVFSYIGHDGSSGALQDFRGKKPVLLVIFSWPQSQARIEYLKEVYNQLMEQDIALLAVPQKELTADEITQITALPFPVVTESAAEIASSYALMRRTLGHPDIIGRGSIPDHMEFLIDRYGYLRARWIPSLDQAGWADIDKLNRQISLLSRENIKMPFPEDYVR